MASTARVQAEIVWNIIPEFTAKMNAEAKEVKARALERIAEEARLRVRVDSGATQESIQVLDDTVDAGEAALFLEYGTVKMAAYPFLGPAADAVQRSFKDEFVAMFAIESL